jgi:hypothetical protein
MPKRLWSPELPLVCQRRFEPSRVEQQLWSEAYEQLVPEGRRSLASADSGRRCRKQAQEVPVVSHSQEEKCA